MFNKFEKYFGLLGLFLFFFLISKIDLYIISSQIKRINLYLLFFVFFLNFIIIFLYVYRWKIILDRMSIRSGNFWNLLVVWFKGFVTGYFTPGRVGEIYRAKLLYHQYPDSKIKLALSVFLDRIFDLTVLMVFSFFGFLYLLIFIKYRMNILSYIILGSMSLAMMLIVVFNKYTIILIYTVLKKVFPKRRFRMIIQIKYSLSLLNTKSIHLCFLSTIINWLLTVVSVYILSISLSLDIPLHFLSAILPVSNVISVLPISISGIGTRDLFFVFILKFINISYNDSMLLSFSILVMFNLINYGIGLLFYLNKQKR